MGHFGVNDQTTLIFLCLPLKPEGNVDNETATQRTVLEYCTHDATYICVNIVAIKYTGRQTDRQNSERDERLRHVGELKLLMSLNKTLRNTQLNISHTPATLTFTRNVN